MLRYKLIRNLLILSLTIAVLLPGYDFIFVHPAYQQLIAEQTEKEAVRYASYMVRTLGLEDQLLTRAILPADLDESLQPVARDQQLLKLRVFSADGTIIFSTEAKEVGTVNQNQYFHAIVAKGRVYSKVVQKDHKTAEGALSLIDIVETYVPFMVGGQFGGAFEVYYNISDRIARAEAVSLRSHAATALLTLVFLLAICVALYRAHVSLQERDSAEEALRVANEALEQRVDERTRELVDANALLTEQISERIQVQEALSRALEAIRLDREKLDEILRSVPDGVIVADGSLHVLHMNMAAERILGTTLQEVAGQPIGRLTINNAFLRSLHQNFTPAGLKTPFDIALSGDDQKTSVFQVRTSQFVSEHTESAGFVMLIRDVTRERELESMKSAFLGMAAHELNTPLTSIVGYTELLTAKETADQLSRQQKADFLQLIHGKALALGRLVDDLLDISRIESGRRLPLNYEEFPLDETLHEIVAACRSKTSQHTFDLVLTGTSAPICADPARLEQVLHHLLSNAVKYSPDGGRVRITLSEDSSDYVITVSDQGIGMTEAQRAHIFDRFYRADVSDTAVQGVGLGLSIVRHIVLAHHGSIEVESQPGRGTRVTLSLPKSPSGGRKAPGRKSPD